MNQPHLDRRTLLTTVGSATFASSAGCAGLVWGSEDDVDRCAQEGPVTVLPEQSDYKVSDPPFPIYGEPVPEVTVPAPLHDRDVTTTEFVCERHQLYTFIFTRCSQVCPALTGVLRRVQADAIDEGYADEIAFLPVTFDPEHDTAAVLEEYMADHGVNREPEHWFTLRPESEQRAKEVIHETFGQEFAKLVDDEEDDDDGYDPEDFENRGDMVGEDEEEEDTMPFMHLSLILLVNKKGFLERAWAYEVPDYQTVIDDARALAEEW